RRRRRGVPRTAQPRGTRRGRRTHRLDRGVRSAPREHTARDAGPLRRGGRAAARRARAAGTASAAADARRVRRAAPCPRPGQCATACDRSRPRALARALRTARIREDDARPHRREHDRRRIRGAVGGVGNGVAGPRRAGARTGAARRERASDDPVPRRDPPLQQGAAGRAPAGCRGGPRDADRRDHREPVLRAQLGPALAHAAVRARAPRRGAAELGVTLSEEVEQLVARRGGGDARSALAILELAAQTAADAKAPIDAEHVEDAARKRPLVYDKAGDAHYDFISAWIKSTRAGDVQASVYYLAVMLEGGEDPRFIARRMIVLASEDIGNADPQALLVAVAAAQAVEHVGLPEARLNLA